MLTFSLRKQLLQPKEALEVPDQGTVAGAFTYSCTELCNAVISDVLGHGAPKIKRGERICLVVALRGKDHSAAAASSHHW